MAPLQRSSATELLSGPAGHEGELGLAADRSQKSQRDGADERVVDATAVPWTGEALATEPLTKEVSRVVDKDEGEDGNTAGSRADLL
jgi:hypothetical protein